MNKSEIAREKVIDSRIGQINDELEYLNEEFSIIRNGVGHIIKMISEEKSLNELSS